MNIYIFGAGENYWLYRKWFQYHNVLGVLDNLEALWGKYIDNHKIISPKKISDSHYDRIYIVSSYVNEIRNQLIYLGVDERKIFFTFQLISLIGHPLKNYDCYGKNYPNKSLQIVIITHELSLTGAPMCLLYLADYFIKRGWGVTVVSPFDGELRKEFISLGIRVIIDEILLISDNFYRDYLDECNLVVVNTVKMYYLLENCYKKKPTIWWLHEPESLYKYVPDNAWEVLNFKKICICIVSEFAKRVFLKYSRVKNENISILPFGIPDCKSVYDCKIINDYMEKITFVVVGEISKLKGHDVLNKAMLLLTDMSDKYRIVYIGNSQNEFANEVKKQIIRYRFPVEIKGKLAHSEVMLEIHHSNVVLCASREESMSASIVEGMMLGKICVVTNNTGIADYIEDGSNGFVCNVEDAKALSDKMRFIIENYHRLKDVGNAARYTYETYFSINKFEKNISKILHR